MALNVPPAMAQAPTQGQQAQGNAAIAPYHSASLYVGDLSKDVAEATLFEIFSQVGPVASIRVCRDTVTRRSLGYAYVNFHNVADAERALDTMNFTTIKDQACRIMWSQRDPSLRRSGVGNIFVKNLDETVDNKALYDTFSLFGNILSCKVATDDAGESKGYGYVHYETGVSANMAITKINGMLIAGKQVHVGHFVRRDSRAGQTDWTNLYVKGLPTSWDDAKLREEFEKHGAVTSCKVQVTPQDAEESKDKEKEKEKTGGSGKSRGFGFVNFEEHESAVKAIEAFNGTGPQAAPATNESLSAAALAAAPPEKQKNMIGERLYPLIYEGQPALAGKITGMLLEMDNGELLHLLESPEALSAKINEALQVLSEHQQEVN